MRKVIKKLGASQIMLAIIVAVGSISTAFVTSFATSSNSIEQVKGDVRVVEKTLKGDINLVSNTENLHYAEVQKQLESMDKKLDAIIKNSK